MAHVGNSVAQHEATESLTCLSRSRASTTLSFLASRYERSEEDVVEALKCCNGHVYTAASVLAHWKMFQQLVAQATARTNRDNHDSQSVMLDCSTPDLVLSLPIVEAELPLRCRTTGELVWVSKRLDMLFGKKADNCADKAVTAVATSDVGNGIGNVAKCDAMPFFRKRVAISEIIARLEFLMEGNAAKKV